MPTLPQRNLLTAQAIAYLSEEIRGGQWGNWLPSERKLAQDLQISRNTVRAALAHLQHEGWVAPEHGAGNRIIAAQRPPGPAAVSHDIAFICPQPLERLRPHVTLWIDELRALLSERGCRVRLFHGTQYFRGSAGPALAKLTKQQPHGCWVLMLSSEAIQRWFARSGLPCVIAGSCHEGVNIPCVDLDHRAMCRHAAGVLLGLGHRRMAFLHSQVDRAGDRESAAGFLEAAQHPSHSDVEPTVITHDDTTEGVGRVVRRLVALKHRPTALLVANPYCFLTVTTTLTHLGLKVPQDMSVLSRDDDPFLSFLVPKPSRYAASAEVFARNMLRSILAVLKTGDKIRPVVRTMPDFIRGESLCSPS